MNSHSLWKKKHKRKQHIPADCHLLILQKTNVYFTFSSWLVGTKCLLTQHDQISWNSKDTNMYYTRHHSSPKNKKKIWNSWVSILWWIRYYCINTEKITGNLIKIQWNKVLLFETTKITILTCRAIFWIYLVVLKRETIFPSIVSGHNLF